MPEDPTLTYVFQDRHYVKPLADVIWESVTWVGKKIEAGPVSLVSGSDNLSWVWNGTRLDVKAVDLMMPTKSLGCISSDS
ncbi:hypothetical protein N7540_002779 [Penicillium herquei]|nr:hypothetical protein N7540_002779 [Penicillium herquei]